MLTGFRSRPWPGRADRFLRRGDPCTGRDADRAARPMACRDCDVRPANAPVMAAADSLSLYHPPFFWSLSSAAHMARIRREARPGSRPSEPLRTARGLVFFFPFFFPLSFGTGPRPSWRKGPWRPDGGSGWGDRVWSSLTSRGLPYQLGRELRESRDPAEETLLFPLLPS